MRKTGPVPSTHLVALALMLGCMASHSAGPGATAPDPLPACRRTVPVAGMAALAPAVTAARPGDCLLLADGGYGDASITAAGRPEAPIQIRAANRLAAVATSLTVVKAAHLIVEGVSTGTLLVDDSKHTRITRCKVTGGPAPSWIRIDVQKGCKNGCTDTPPSASGQVRIDHCDIGPGTTDGDIMNPTGLSEHVRIDHNHFHDVSGRHVITVGCCGPKYDYHDTNHVIEHNLFTNVRGGELISIKASATTFRHNTIRGSGGDVDIRAGRKGSIHGNFIFGPDGGGIRMYEDDHRISNNYVETGKALQMGPANASHAAVRNAVVVWNTFVGSVATSGTGNAIENNLVVGGGDLGPGNMGGSAAQLGLVRQGELLVPAPGGKPVGAPPGRPLLPADVGPDAP